eukprot:gnl/TRDRNA2_/TRDRNA2_61704_c0_seq1.p1 gnl/TRDRNA2_/TRDRNA2_61704_c0~~gnl/TRDRNA2_/TRDRNA2_61704_c0_seq1.p1  ORF type:complete len:413 (+),score=58.04 gnl/TRDRNA2_/TRDRNA2_61704_c0_seq1:48-1286(+)
MGAVLEQIGATQSEEEVSITVRKALTGEDLMVVKLLSTDTVEQLRQALRKKLGTGTVVRLLVGERLLPSTETLIEAGLTNGSAVDVVWQRHHCNMLVTTSLDSTARVWRLDNGTCQRRLAGHFAPVLSAEFSPDGLLLATGSQDRTVRIWQVDTGECIRIFQGHHDHVRSVAFSPDGTYLVSGSNDMSAILWTVDSGRMVALFDGHTDRITSVAFSPNGSLVATGSVDNTARVWDAQKGECIGTIDEHSDCIRSVDFAPGDDLTLVTGSADYTAMVWKLENKDVMEGDCHVPDCVVLLQGHRAPVHSAKFSNLGDVLVTTCSDGTAKVWNANSGHCIFTLDAHNGQALWAAFSPDDFHIVTCGAGPGEHVAKVWNVQSGKCVASLEGHTNVVCFAAFSYGSDDAAFLSDNRE